MTEKYMFDWLMCNVYIRECRTCTYCDTHQFYMFAGNTKEGYRCKRLDIDIIDADDFYCSCYEKREVK